MEKRAAGAALIGGALVLALVAALWWEKQSRDVDYDHDVWQMEVVMDARLGNPIPSEPEPHRAGPIALGAIAGVLFIAGIVLIAAPPDINPPDEPESSDHPSPETGTP